MAREIIRESETVPAEQTERSVVTERVEQGPATIVSKIIYTIFSIIIALLALRFVLALLGANTANSIVNFIYDISQPFIAPFANFFTNADRVTTTTGFRFELDTLIAIIFYILVGWLIARLAGIFDSREKL